MDDVFSIFNTILLAAHIFFCCDNAGPWPIQLRSTAMIWGNFLVKSAFPWRFRTFFPFESVLRIFRAIFPAYFILWCEFPGIYWHFGKYQSFGYISINQVWSGFSFIDSRKATIERRKVKSYFQARTAVIICSTATIMQTNQHKEQEKTQQQHRTTWTKIINIRNNRVNGT